MKLKNKTFAFIVILASTFLCSCWHENLNQCWKGDVVLSIAAERFGELPDKPSEPDLGAKISDFQYYLFSDDGSIADRGNIDVSSVHEDHYDLIVPTLPFGGYTLALTANTGGKLVDADDWQSLRLECQEASGSDYFASLYTFALDCECGHADFVKLYRTKGIVEVRLEDLPASISRVRVDISPVSAFCLPDTTYEGRKAIWGEALTAMEAGAETVSLNLDAFPTPEDETSRVALTLYMTDSKGREIVAAEQELTNTLRIIRNQRVGVLADFNNSITGIPSVIVMLNPDWDGVNGDTDVDIN